jgi:flagellar biosynthesis chaperone FliJ
MPTNQDRGLAAVARVRENRERAARLALERTMGRVRADEGRLAQRHADLEATGAFHDGTARDFHLSHQSVHLVVEGIRAAERALEQSRAEAASAHGEWSRCKAELRAVELLLDRREERRREARDEDERKELDEMARNAWARTRTGGAA